MQENATTTDTTSTVARPTVAEVQECIDEHRFWRDFDAAVYDAMRARDRRTGWYLFDQERVLRPVPQPPPMIAEDFPERFRAEFDPDLDNDFGDSIGGTDIKYSEELAEAIRAHATTPGPVKIFTDPRDGVRWVLLPAWLLFEGPEAKDYEANMAAQMPGEPPGISGVIPFPPGRELTIPGAWLEVQDGPGRWVIGPDGSIGMEG